MNCWLCKNEIKGEPLWTNCRMLCQSCYDKPRHRYYYLNRPPSIGCQPDGFVDREAWMPARTHPVVGGGTRHFLGWVEYPTPLEPEQVWKWELLPRTAWETERYFQWREDNNR